MTNNAPDRYDGLPASWSDSAREVYVQIEEANPALDAAQRASLYEAAAALAAVDAMQAVVNANGLMVLGSQAQPVAHPLIAEIRQYRRDAQAALRNLGLKGIDATAASRAGASLVGARWGR